MSIMGKMMDNMLWQVDVLFTQPPARATKLLVPTPQGRLPPPFSEGGLYTCLYVHIRAITCKNMTLFEQGFLARRERKSTYWHISYVFFYIFICNSYVVVRIEKNTTKNTFTSYLYVFWWFPRLISKAACVLYTKTLRNVRTSTYYYVCLRTYMDYVLVYTYTILCTYMFAYVSLR